MFLPASDGKRSVSRASYFSLLSTVSSSQLKKLKLNSDRKLPAFCLLYDRRFKNVFFYEVGSRRRLFLKFGKVASAALSPAATGKVEICS